MSTGLPRAVRRQRRHAAGGVLAEAARAAARRRRVHLAQPQARVRRRGASRSGACTRRRSPTACAAGTRSSSPTSPASTARASGSSRPAWPCASATGRSTAWSSWTSRARWPGSMRTARTGSTPTRREIAHELVKEISERLTFLRNVGLNYLDARPQRADALRRREPAHPPGEPDRQRADRRALRAGRAEHRLAPARQPQADRRRWRACATWATP